MTDISLGNDGIEFEKQFGPGPQYDKCQGAVI